MKTGACPSCGAPVEFPPGVGQVRVCEHCHTVVLRGEANLEKVGQVAELIDTDSPLKLRLPGQYAGARFEVAGRLQKAHAGDQVYGAWDEWYLTFDDGRTAWLSESEGEWNLMFPLPSQRPPAFADARPGVEFTLKGTRFVTEEKAQAKTVSAEGALPSFHPDHPFVDATGPKGVFVSIDYGGGEPGEAFIGNRVNLSQLGFDKNELAPSPKRQAMSQARCTECNGPLDLKAPDLTRRVCCPFCSALLDCSHGKLQFLQLLTQPKLPPPIPLGRKGTLDGVEWTVIAFLVRSCEVEFTRYAWDELLLYAPGKGYRWLMSANGHWTLLTPISAGEVVTSFKSASYGGESYQLYQSVNTRTDFVMGECYWAVSAGETGWAAEYIHPPKSINLDRTENEVTFTHGVLVDRKVLQDAFKLKDAFPAPISIAPAQVNPWKERASAGWKWAGLWSAAMIGLFIVFSALSTSGTYFTQGFSVPHGAAPASPEAIAFTEPFKVSARVPLEVKVSTTGLSNQWLGVQTDFVNTDTWEVASIYFELSDYHGVTDGESWREGDESLTKTTAEVDPGNYLMRLTPSFDPANPPPSAITVKAEADPPGLCCPIFLVLLILCLPIYGSIRSSAFESSRWGESVMQAPDFSPAAKQRSRAPIELDEDEEDDE